MPNKEGQKKVVDNFTIKTISQQQNEAIEEKKEDIKKYIDNEKVEVLIKEVIRIKPTDFSAFKHALEDFVNDWDK
jgi:hypothetical protein